MTTPQPQHKYVVYAQDLALKIRALRKSGFARKGVSTGWPVLDEYMTLAKGMLTIGTGYPSCGKSEFCDAMLMNLSILHGWKTLYFSPENFPIEEHAKKLMERYIGKPLFKMSSEEELEGLMWVQNHAAFIHLPDDKFGLLAVLEIAQAEMERRPFDVLVLDPWNEVSQFSGQREDLHLSKEITSLKRFLRKNDVHGVIIAHPTKPREKEKDSQGRMDYPIPKLYDISGGAIWRNKAEYGWVVHRFPTDNYMSLHIQKIKQKNLGKIGEVVFDYEWNTGRFKTQSQDAFTLPSTDKSEDVPT
jgi:twinkle protein